MVIERVQEQRIAVRMAGASKTIYQCQNTIPHAYKCLITAAQYDKIWNVAQTIWKGITS
jgi:hypothetical protein